MLLVYGNVGRIYHPDLTVQFSYLRAAGTLPRAAEKQNQPSNGEDTNVEAEQARQNAWQDTGVERQPNYKQNTNAPKSGAPYSFQLAESFMAPRRKKYINSIFKTRNAILFYKIMK